MALNIPVYTKSHQDVVISLGENEIRCGANQSNLDAIYQLRAKIFSEELQWVPKTTREVDAYDARAVHVAVSGADKLKGVLRILDSSEPWMLQKEFKCLAPKDMEQRISSDSCEVTRLAVEKTNRGHRFGSGLSTADRLYQGLFVHCLLNNIRYVYMVVSTTVLRVLRFAGLPCKEISQTVCMPDGVRAVAAVLDWSLFVEDGLNRRPQLVALYMDALKQATVQSVESMDFRLHRA